MHQIITNMFVVSSCHRALARGAALDGYRPSRPVAWFFGRSPRGCTSRSGAASGWPPAPSARRSGTRASGRAAPEVDDTAPRRAAARRAGRRAAGPRNRIHGSTSGETGLDVVERFVDLLREPVYDVTPGRAGNQLGECVKRLGRKHRIGADVGVCLLGLWRCPSAGTCRRGPQVPRLRRAVVRPVRLTGSLRRSRRQERCARALTSATQPPVAVIAIVDRLADGMLGAIGYCITSTGVSAYSTSWS